MQAPPRANIEVYASRPYDLVVTVCDRAKESCPVLPGAQRLEHWPFPDPADATGTEEEQLEVFRAVRDQIRQHLSEFLDAD